MTGDPRPWLDIVIARAAELRKAGVLSIACDGNSVVFAPAEPGTGDDKGDDKAKSTGVEIVDEPVNAWENPNSYPTGIVPVLEVDPEKDLPEIPDFGDV